MGEVISVRSELLKARRDSGLTQGQVAEAVGIDRTAYNRIERGVQRPTVDVALRIAAVLGRPVEALFLPSIVQDLHSADQAAARESA
ncbi:MAG: helix-turn-helix transcriptional regulator [Bacillota bacterium]|nr:helix-turn-helix transcriptional regulator [Bacillota bacterium]